MRKLTYYNFDYYAFLGIPHDASLKAIKKAYRKLARKWHPDCNLGDKDLTDKFKQLVNIYEVLSDEAKKEEYDKTLLLSPLQSAVVPAPSSPEPSVVRPVSKHGGPFTKERVKQDAFYPKNWKAKVWKYQAEKIGRLFPAIDLLQVENLVTMPKLADGIAILPKISSLGKLWGIADPCGEGYSHICEKLFELISTSRMFSNCHADKMDEGHLRMFAEVQEKLQALEAKTPGDVLILPFNFGNLYAGYSPRSAYWEALNNGQLPLITAQVACLLLTMPDRLYSWEQLSIICSGDSYSWNADGAAGYSLCFMHGDYLYFGSGHADRAYGSFGSAVAFLGSGT